MLVTLADLMTLEADAARSAAAAQAAEVAQTAQARARAQAAIAALQAEDEARRQGRTIGTAQIRVPGRADLARALAQTQAALLRATGEQGRKVGSATIATVHVPSSWGLGQGPARTSGPTLQSSGSASAVPAQTFKLTLDSKAVAQAQTEAQQLADALAALRDDSSALSAYFKSLEIAVAASRSKLAKAKATYQSLKQQGMGELLRLERESGSLADPQSLSGFFDSLRKSFSNFDKNVLQKVTHPIGNVLHQFDKSVIQPVAHPIGGVLKQFDKAVIQPVAHPIGAALNKLDKAALRPVYQPVAKGVMKANAFLDKYVPGWTVALNMFVPGGGLLVSAFSGAMEVAGGIPVVGVVLPQLIQGGLTVAGHAAQFGISTASGQGGAWNLLPNAEQSALGRAVSFGQVTIGGVAQPIVTQALGTTQAVVGIANALPFTVAKMTAVYLSTKGNVLLKLEATGIEALSEVNLVLQAAALIVTFGTAAPGLAAASAASMAAVAAMKTTLQVQMAGGKWTASDIATVGFDAAIALAGGLGAGGIGPGAGLISPLAAPVEKALQIQEAGGKWTAMDIASVGFDVAAAAGNIAFQAVPALKDAQAAWAVVRTTLSTMKNAGVSVANALELRQQLRSAADKHKRLAEIEIARIRAEEAAYEAEVAKMEGQIAAIRQQRVRVLALKSKAPRPDTDGSVIGGLAEQVGVSETTLILGGLVAVGGVVLVLALATNDEGEED
jgi:hypothetical protein